MMSKKQQLRATRTGTVINLTSRRQESELGQALIQVETNLRTQFGENLALQWESQWLLRDIVSGLRNEFPDVEFHYHFERSAMCPDGGLLRLLGPENDTFTYPILITEVKNQGTNDQRLQEGLKKQAKGNAIERLGKNVIGLRTALLRETIFPFVCFGYGCDFAADSSILDRVTTIAMYGQLNRTYLHNEGNGQFNRGSFYFREERWAIDEMVGIMTDIAERAVLYYYSKYGRERFGG